MSACRDLVGDCWMIKLFKVGPRSLQRWVALRPYVDEDSIRENYLEKHETLLNKLMGLPGGGDVARAIVSRHAHLVGCELTCTTPAEPDKPTVEGECLDDYPALVAFHQSIQAGQSYEEIRYHWQQAKRELDETWTAFCRSEESDT